MNFNTYNTWVATYDFRFPRLSSVVHYLQSHTVFYFSQCNTRLLCWICRPPKLYCYTRLCPIIWLFIPCQYNCMCRLKVLYTPSSVSHIDLLIYELTGQAKWCTCSCWSKVLFTWQHVSTTAMINGAIQHNLVWLGLESTSTCHALVMTDCTTAGRFKAVFMHLSCIC